MNNKDTIRNFAIIAHVDHGKSTLADRFLELTNIVQIGKHEEQLLDRNPISRERGITIKLAPVKMLYKLQDQDLVYTLYLIDTPGHVDFSYEVDRTLACVEGVILLVDATQGIQAQTISNAYKALEKNLHIIPVVNKIDMPNSDTEGTVKQIIDFLGVSKEDIFKISAKQGTGVKELLDTVVKTVSPPRHASIVSQEVDSLQSLIFDSYYDQHKGVIAFVRMFGGTVQKGKKCKLCANGIPFEITEVGSFTPELNPLPSITEGEIGYIVTNLKSIHEVQVGDTIVSEKKSAPAVSGYKKVRSMIYASMFPTDPHDYLNLKKALEKLFLNDSSLEFSAIYSKAFGAGFRVGFLGLLHADVVRERLEREFELDLILTPPQVDYKKEGDQYLEPIVKIFILTPEEYLGSVMKLCENYRGTFITMDNANQISITYEMPLSEMITDFFDSLKSATSGYASLDWELIRQDPVNANQMEIMLNGEPVDEFSEVVVHERAFEKASQLTRRLKEVIPRQMFEVRIQARYKGKIIASERISAFRKDVTAKLYGGDRTRKDKLLKKQKEGKKKMKSIGTVEIPKEAFVKLFKQEG